MHLLRHLKVLKASFPEHFPPDCVARLKCDLFYGGLPKWLKAMTAYLKASTNEKTYSNYLWVAREAEKEEAMEPSHNQTADNQSKPKLMAWVVHLEQDSADKGESPESDDPNGIKGMMEEFIVHLACAVKEAQQNEKHCYHCSSLEHFICECQLVKSSRSTTHLNQKEMAPETGAWTPQVKATKPKVPQEGMPKAYDITHRLPS